MIRFNFEKDELKELAEKVYLSDRQKRIIEYRMLDFSIVKMADLENCGTTTINRELNKALYKIGKYIRR
jgi:hypothetical protein